MWKKGILFLFIAFCVTVGVANGAGRSGAAGGGRATGAITQSRQSQNNIPRSGATSRANSNAKISRSAVPTKNTVARSSVVGTTARSGANILSRGEQKSRVSVPKKQVVGRVATNTTTTTTADLTANFGSGYETCRDAYFTCMDQFCATVDETYRRCVCSSRLSEIKQKQKSLSTAADSLTGFHDLNLTVVNKTADEVRAMMSASEGEQVATTMRDKSDSMKQLNAIGDVLSQRREQSAANTAIDFGSGINSIWSTTDLASGADIAKLTGESLYNAVNSQCFNLVSDQCPSGAILNMVVSAYGMYIENDCTTLATDLSNKKLSANANIRETTRELGAARLENYDAHNSLSINDCITSIRADITQNTACGADFVHCLDFTGLYLNIDTGEPIYTKNFFDLDNMISISGNVLREKSNKGFISILNNKKVYAQGSLDKCRDLSGSIWNEFMRQALIEIHQNQQERIKKVKSECLSVVNECYDKTTVDLRDYTNVDEHTLIGLRLEAVEGMCREKLNTCSNLYGGGPNGMYELVNVMSGIGDQKILAECQSSLNDFARTICTPKSDDIAHTYPYDCRTNAPGNQQYAQGCFGKSQAKKKGGPIKDSDYITGDDNCTTDLYHQMVKYASQVCIRPSISTDDTLTEIPTLVLQDVNIVMDKLRIEMHRALSAECEKYGGTWVAIPYDESLRVKTQEHFDKLVTYDKKWGYCQDVADAQSTGATYILTFSNGAEYIGNGLGQRDSETPATVDYVTTAGTMLGRVAVPKRTGYTFAGYYAEQNGVGIKYYDENGALLDNGEVTSAVAAVQSDTTLYARWTPNTYTVTFEYIIFTKINDSECTCVRSKQERSVEYGNTIPVTAPMPPENRQPTLLGNNPDPVVFIGYFKDNNGNECGNDTYMFYDENADATATDNIVKGNINLKACFKVDRTGRPLYEPVSTYEYQCVDQGCTIH